MKSILKTFITVTIVAHLVSAQGTGSPVEVLFKNNKDILAAEKAYQSALEAIGISGVLPDPMIEGTLFLAPIETRNGPMEGQVMLGQKFPLWGKLNRERQVAKLKADITGYNLQQKRIKAAFKMRKAWTMYVRLTNSLRILNEYRSELKSFQSIALTQYATGVGGTQHPILKLQIEMSLIETQINNLESDYESTVNELQALFDGYFSPDLFGDEWKIRPAKGSTGDLLELAMSTHPWYKISMTEKQVAVLQNELAVRKNYPDLVAGVTYTAIGPETEMVSADAGRDAFGFKIGLNLPLWFKRNKARIASTKMMVKSKEEMIEEIWNQVVDEVLSANKELYEIEETYTLYETKLLQESEQMLSSAFAAYETGKISFLDLLDSERMVVRVRLDFEKIKANKNITTARLLRAIGLVHPM